ncbi:hypothetical protein [Aeromicrobium sp. 9AM]|uniref:hypothetical protein n=1 Tax=Aeromicrobium sp. 9AM TaxID=2653126 RepID=UPI0012EF9ACC|nr:hypothetical protein [Aeromicrobium sp. 9AM]VXB15355.1 conserved exported hypothetical protein [Aeromicrobium sp. 9AM]
MRMSKIHKVAVTAVVATIATATVLTFSRADTAPADHVASLPQASADAPVVAERRPEAIKKPKPTPRVTTAEPKAPAVKVVKPVAKADKPAPTAKPAPTTAAPSPTPTPTPKNLLEILLGQ